jgi:LuxR family maltose regulon positive regulatory protein
LATKLHFPAPRPDLVPRPCLIEQLNAGLHRKLTLLSAPAGFGKTTLLSEWAARSQVPIAWLSLDGGDNDPARFWAYVVAVLRTVCADLGDVVQTPFQSPGGAGIEPSLTALLNQLAEVPEPLAPVLDDYHAIDAQPIH